jgi:signal transduction histidine kinase
MQIDEPIFLGTAPASAADGRRALVAVLLLLAAFAATAPWAGRQLPAVPAFAPIYNAAVIILDLLTALLLYAQFRQLQQLPFLVLACGYLFTPILMAAHALSFPNAFGPGTLIGGGQTTAWLWMEWHGVFPLFVVAYAVLAKRERRAAPRLANPLRPRVAAITVGGTVALAVASVLLATLGDALLPQLMIGDRYRSLHTQLILLVGWLVHLVALVLLIRATGLRRLIDLWIAVTLVALLIDLALSALLITARYQLGFYLGRVYGLLAAAFVLGVLLRESVALYGTAIRSAAILRESEARFRALVTASADLVYRLSPDGTSMRPLDGRGRLSGPLQSSAAWVARDVHPDDRSRVTAAIEEAVRTKSSFELEHRVLRPDGSVGWTLSRAVPLLDPQGEIVEWVGAATDVTPRKQSEAAAERAQREAARDELRRALAGAEEAERRRLARELHDELGQQLTAFALGLGEVHRLAGPDHPAGRRLAQLDQLTSAMSRNVRNLALELRPPELDDVGLESAVETYVAQWAARYGMAAELVKRLPADRPVPAEVGTALYRILQEALTNVAKHAGATQVSIIIERADGAIRLIVEDDGSGFDVEAAAARTGAERRLGLAGMRERAALVGGTLTIESRVNGGDRGATGDGGGTTLYARLPIERPG